MIFINLAVHMGFTSLEPLYSGVLLVAVIVAMTVGCAWLSARYVEGSVVKLLKKKG